MSSGSNVLEGHVKIYSNEMLFEDDISTGELSMCVCCIRLGSVDRYTYDDLCSRRMVSGRDKAALLRKLLQEGQDSKSQSESRSVFIGDSYSDIQPLLMVWLCTVSHIDAAFVIEGGCWYCYGPKQSTSFVC